MTKTKQIVYSAVFLILGVVIPQAFHFIPIGNTGSVLLPMHISVLLCGFFMGPWWGVLVGGITPALSSLLTGMPPMQRLPFMVIELAIYGLIAGLCYRNLKLKNSIVRIYLSLVIAMIAGRGVYALCLLVATKLLHLQMMGPIAAVNATIQGIPGILIQLVLIPPIVYQGRKSGLFYGSEK